MGNDKRAVVLLSGGMDSTYAATWACHNMDPAAFLFVEYGQRGQGYEKAAAATVAGWLMNAFKITAPFKTAAIRFTSINPLTSAGADLDPKTRDEYDNPATFLPGRNMAMISLAANLAYTLHATEIVGGWVSIDVDYPDCTPNFLQYAEITLNYALGLPVGQIAIRGPTLYRTKEEVVYHGRRMAVPFHLTRSCYADRKEPCWECDSCLVRARAFLANDIRDPICPEDKWEELKERLTCQDGSVDCSDVPE